MCLRSTGQVLACSSAMVPNNFTVYRSVTGSTFLYPSRDGYAWVVGNKLCRDDIGYAFTAISYVGGDGDVTEASMLQACPTESAACAAATGCPAELSAALAESWPWGSWASTDGSPELLALIACFDASYNPGQAMSMPCETGTVGDVCTWRACSTPQFFGSSCEMDCPDDAGLSRAHNRNCPPLTPTTEGVVAAIGTHSDSFVATHDSTSVSGSCSGYTRDVDDPATPTIDEAVRIHTTHPAVD